MKGLEGYFRILSGETKPKFMRRMLPREESKKHIEECRLCEIKCRANRKVHPGFCGARDFMEVSSVFLHYWEEDFFVPSLTVFFCGCNFRCVFCQNYTISRRMERCRRVEPKELAEEIERFSGARNINFVGGEPTPYIPFVVESLSFLNVRIPIIWNSNFYMSREAMDILSAFTDVYLSDWKYGNDKCAKRLSGVKNYWEVVRRNHDLAFDDGDLVIRHLVLPNHFSCCTEPILKYIAENYGDKVVVNVMDQYRPEYRAFRYPEISRHPTEREILAARQLADDLGLNWIG